MHKKNKVFLATLCILLLTVLSVPAAFAQTTVDVITNGAGGSGSGGGTGGGTGGGGGGGGTPSYSVGSVVVISGQVLNDGIPLPNGNVSVQVKNPSNSVVFYADTPTDSQGFYRTIFALPQSSFTGQYTVNVNSLAASGSAYFSVTGTGKEGPSLIGWSPQGCSLSTPMETIPLGTRQIGLVFNKNVNYFHNSNHPDFEIGANENNEDSISIYKGDSSTPVPFRMQLISSDAQSSSNVSYFDINDNEVSSTEGKRAIILNLTESLSANTNYKIVISKDLCANNGIKLGQDIPVYFKTGSANSAPTGNTNTGGPNQPSTPASDVGKVTQNGQTTTLQVDNQKALEIIKNDQLQSLSIDISTMVGTAGTKASVQLPAGVVEAAQQAAKPIVLQNGNLAIVIPPAALPQGQDVEISTCQVDEKTVPAAPNQVTKSAVYEFNARVGNGQTHQFQQALTITLPIPQGIADPNKLGVYCLNETTSQWEYVGGRIMDGKLVFTTNHFSKYMVAESQKTFTDISNHWAKGTIEIMVARQIVNGVNTNEFAPDRNITRAEFATLLTKVLKLTEKTPVQTFGDVAPTAWYADYVAKAAKIGLISGYNGQFRPNDQINRQEMSAMIMRAYNYKNGKTENSKELNFVDKDAISPWAAEAVKGAYNIGVIQGRGEGKFAPLDNATRAEATVMLKSLMDKLEL